METRDMAERIRQKKFFRNNGMVLKGINMLRTQYVRLADLRYALEASMTEAELVDCVNYLSESGFIKTRNCHTKQEVTLADCPFDDLEAKVSSEGIKIIACARVDECIDV